MKPGSDRFEIGAYVFETWFPGGVGFVADARPGDDLQALRERLGAEVEGAFRFPIDDAPGNDRKLLLAPHISGKRALALSARMLSRDRMDIDAAWRPIKDHLDRVHGPAGKESGHVLKFTWKHAGPLPMVTSAWRYRNDAGENVLEVDLRLQPGVSLPEVRRPA